MTPGLGQRHIQDEIKIAYSARKERCVPKMMKACLKDTGDNMKELQMTKPGTILATK